MKHSAGSVFCVFGEVVSSFCSLLPALEGAVSCTVPVDPYFLPVHFSVDHSF